MERFGTPGYSWNALECYGTPMERAWNAFSHNLLNLLQAVVGMVFAYCTKKINKY
jgi:hypothetical protein